MNVRLRKFTINRPIRMPVVLDLLVAAMGLNRAY